MRTLLLVLLLALASLTPCVHAADPGPLTIRFTANSGGKLRECSCPGDPYGGLAERVTVIDNIRKTSPEPFLLLDAGDMVGLFGDYTLKARTVMQLMNLMGYDAAAAGENELFRGVGQALETAGAARFPILSASIVRASDNSQVFPSHAILHVGAVTVGVTAVCDSSCYVTVQEMNYDYRVLPLEKALPPALDALADCDWIVVLSQMVPEANSALLARYPAVDLVIQGYGNQRTAEPVVTRDGVIVAPGADGAFVGTIVLRKNGGIAAVERVDWAPVLDVRMPKKAAELVKDYYEAF